MRAALLILPLLSGCAVREASAPPPAPVATTFPYAEGVPATTAARDIGWQGFFPDPRLQRLIALALANNRDLALSVARIAEAGAQVGLARADRFPTLRAGATLRLGDRTNGVGGTDGIVGGSGGDAPDAPDTPGVPGDDPSTGGQGGSGGGGRYNLQLSVASYEVDFWGRVASLNAAARAGYLGRVEAARAFRVSLIRDLAEAYVAERDLDARIALAEAALETRREALRLTGLRADAGEATRIDLRQAELLVTQASTALAVLRRERAQNANLIVLLVGAPLPVDLPPPRPLDRQGIAETLSPGLPSDLLLARPDIASAEADLRARGADVAAARAAFLPRIALTGSAGFASQSLGQLFNGFLWSFVPSLLQPIFDGGRNRANLDLAQARRDAAVATYERSIQIAFREVSDALAARRFLSDQLAAERQAVVAQTERARLSRRRYEEGVASFIEVLDAERELFTAQQALIEVRRDQLIAATRLYAALGGGVA